MLNLGTVRPGSTIRIPFSSFDKDDGSSITMTNYAAADILAYKDGGTTERASTNGYTATTDFDAKTGKHLAVIDLADNTTAGFWNAGSEYLVAIDAVTIDGVTTGGWIARFRIGYEQANLDTTIATLASQTSFTLTAGPAEDDALNGHWAIIHDIASAVQRATVLILDYTGSTRTVTLAAGGTFTAAAGDNISIMDLAPLQPTVLGRTIDVSTGGEAGLDWANIGSPTTAQNLSGTNIDVDQVVASVSGNVGGNVTGSVGSVATGGITAGSIATDAIGASELASDACVEIAAAVWDRVISGANHNVTNSAGKRLREISNSVVTSGTAQAGGTASITLASGASSTDGTYDPAIVRISAGTGLGQSRLIIQYVGSTRVASVDRDWRVTPDNTSEYEIIASQNLISTNEGLAQGGGSSTITLNANASATDNVYVGQTIVLRTGTGQDQSRIITGYVGSTKVATVATPWETVPAAGTGYILWPLGRARVTSMEADVLTASALGSDAATEIGTAVWASGTRTLTALDEDTTTLDLDATIRAAVGLASANLDTQLDALPTAAEAATAVWGAGARTLTAIDEDNTTLDLDATIRGALGMAAADLDTQIDTLATATNLATVDTVVDAIKVTTDKLDGTLENTSDGWIYTVAALQNAPSGGGGLTVQQIVDGVWDEPMADHLDSGTTGASLNGAGSAGDPWTTALPGAYGSGTAGFIVGTNLNATVSSRATQTSVDDVPTNAELATALGTADDAVLTAIGDLPTNSELATALAAADDAVLAAIADLPTNAELATALAAADDAVLAAIDALPTAIENADALLDRNMASGADNGSPTVRTPRQALRILRNRWTIDSDGEQTIMKEDDSTASWTQQLASDGSAQPVTGTDPAGP